MTDTSRSLSSRASILFIRPLFLALLVHAFAAAAAAPAVMHPPWRQAAGSYEATASSHGSLCLREQQQAEHSSVIRKSWEGRKQGR